MGLLSELFYRIGHASIQRRENAVNLDTTDGEWIYNETIRDYEYIEKPITEEPCWVSVVYFEEEYVIIIDILPYKEFEPIVIIECDNSTELKTVIKTLKAVYSPKGNIHIENLVSKNTSNLF